MKKVKINRPRPRCHVGLDLEGRVLFFVWLKGQFVDVGQIRNTLAYEKN